MHLTYSFASYYLPPLVPPLNPAPPPPPPRAKVLLFDSLLLLHPLHACVPFHSMAYSIPHFTKELPYITVRPSLLIMLYSIRIS